MKNNLMIFYRLSSREKGILAACSFVVFLYIGYHFVLKPLYEGGATFEDKIKMNEKRLKENLRLIRQQDSLEEQYQKYSSYFQQTSTDEREMASITSEIESAANTIAMRVVDMKPKKVRRIDFYNNFSVSLTVEGELSNVIHFLYILQNTPHLFRADEVYLERNPGAVNQIRCRLTLSKALIP